MGLEKDLFFIIKCFPVCKRTITGSEAEGEGDEDPAAHTSADAILRDFRYKLQCAFMEPSRDLKALGGGVFSPLLGYCMILLCFIVHFGFLIPWKFDDITWRSWSHLYSRFARCPSSLNLQRFMALEKDTTRPSWSLRRTVATTFWRARSTSQVLFTMWACCQGLSLKLGNNFNIF